VSLHYTDLQLDALRELANIGSGKASTALSVLLGRAVDISVPSARALAFADAVDATGDPEAEVTGIVLGTRGDLEGTVLLLVSPADAEAICAILGAEPGSGYAPSALAEVGNIVGSSYINALAEMTGMAIEPTPPAIATDMLGAIVQSVLGERWPGGPGSLAGVRPGGETRGRGDAVALMLESQLRVEGEDCSIAFMLVPSRNGVDDLLERLGLA
jgi:chemotaxis protein CheC